MLSSLLSSLGIRKEDSSNPEAPQRTWTEWIGSFFGGASVQDVTGEGGVNSSSDQSFQDKPPQNSESIVPWNNKSATGPTLGKEFSLPESDVLNGATKALAKIEEKYPIASATVKSLRNLVEQTKQLRDFVYFLNNRDATIEGFNNKETSAAYANLTQIEDALQEAVVSLKKALKEGRSFDVDKTTFSFVPVLENTKSIVVEAAIRAKGNRAEFEKLGPLSSYADGRSKDTFYKAEQVTNRSETELFNARSEAATICEEISTQLVERLHEFTTSSLPSAKTDSIARGDDSQENENRASASEPTQTLADLSAGLRDGSKRVVYPAGLMAGNSPLKSPSLRLPQIDPSSLGGTAGASSRNDQVIVWEPQKSIAELSTSASEKTTFSNSQLHSPEDVRVLHETYEALTAKDEKIRHAVESELQNLPPSGSAIERASHNEEVITLSAETIKALEQKLLKSLPLEETSSKLSEKKSGKKVLEILSSAEFQVLGFNKKSYVQKIKILFQFIHNTQQRLESARRALQVEAGDQISLFNNYEQALSFYKVYLDALDLVVRERDDFIAQQQRLSSVLSAFKTTTGPEIAVTSGGLSENSVPVVTVAAPLFKVNVKEASELFQKILERAETASLSGKSFSKKPLEELLRETDLVKEELTIKELTQAVDLAQQAFNVAEKKFKEATTDVALRDAQNHTQYALNELRALQTAFREASELNA